MFGVSSSTVDRAVSEVRPLPAARDFAVPDRPGVRLKTLADVFADFEAEGITLRIDGTEAQGRRSKPDGGSWSSTPSPSQSDYVPASIARLLVSSYQPCRFLNDMS